MHARVSSNLTVLVDNCSYKCYFYRRISLSLISEMYFRTQIHAQKCFFLFFYLNQLPIPMIFRVLLYIYFYYVNINQSIDRIRVDLIWFVLNLVHISHYREDCIPGKFS